MGDGRYSSYVHLAHAELAVGLLPAGRRRHFYGGPMTDAETDVLRTIEQRVLWLATRMIDEANAREGGEVKVGGHQASCASMV